MFLLLLLMILTVSMLPVSALVAAGFSRAEGERTAARRCLGAAAVLTPSAGVLIALAAVHVIWPLALITAAVWLAVLVLLVPTGKPRISWQGEPVSRIDERTVMFARAELVPGSDRAEGYYRDHPEHREPDDQWRKLAGLMSSRAGKFEPLSFAAAEASFTAVEQLASLVERPPVGPRREIDPAKATAFCKGWARKLGAVSCGVTRLEPVHIYAVKGRGPRYGEPITLEHPFAIAVTVEMDHRQLGCAPEGPTLMESAEQYMNAGAIAVQMAEAIRNLGWKAEAHIDANYKVVCPLVARDAGLGEIGRMGLLMTPTLGPRVRLAVVTTDLPLETDPPRRDETMLDFCRICRKCADCCPAGAIPAGDPEPIAGVRRWRIDQEVCYTYWCAVGTDCGRCIRVCPFAHPDNLMHRIVRWWLRRSSLMRRLALRLDDLLYGRNPGLLPYRPWLPRRRRVDGTAPDR